VATHSHFAPFRQRVQWLTDVVRREQIQALVPNYFLSGFCAARRLRPTGLQTVAVLHSDDPAYDCILEGAARRNPDFPTDRIVAVSAMLYDRAKWAFPEPEHVYQIPYGIPLSRRVAAPPRQSVRIVYTGRIIQYQKRILDTVRAACSACRRYPNATFDFYGSGPELEECQQIAQTEQLQDRVRFLGFRKSEEVRQALPDYHAILLLSEFEGLPVALLEAMSAGVVPICSRIKSGIPEIVHDGVSGILVDDRERDVSDAIGRILDHPDQWALLSGGARRIATGFSLESCTEKWERVIESLGNAPLESARGGLWTRRALPRSYPAFAWDEMRGPSWNERGARRLRGLRDRLRRYVRLA
jgi:glycosyltransferase involved in cell wall biosynthesis